MVRPSKLTPLLDLNKVEAQAAGWVAELDRGPLAPEALAAFQVWRNQSPRHEAALTQISQLWTEMNGLATLASARVPPRFGRSRRPPNWHWPAAALAATLLLAVGIGAALRYGSLKAAAPAGAATTMQVTANPPVPQVLQTRRGEQRLFVLADGSSVQLNTDSLVEVRYTRPTRAISLLRGEAYFRVAHDRARPFMVFAGEGLVRAVGTQFDVKVDRHAVELTVTQGTVAVASLSRHSLGPIRVAPSALDDAETGSRALGLVSATSGVSQTVTIAAQTMFPKPKTENAVVRELSWRSGVLAFNHEPLAVVVAEVSRYTDVEIEIADPKLRSIEVDAYLKLGQIDPLLDGLESGFGVHVEHLDAHHVRLSAGS